jgi:hypothetical protein
MGVEQWQGDDGSNPTVYTTIGNWVSGAAPAALDDVYFDENSVGTGGCAGSDQSGTTLTSFTVKMTNSYPVGSNGTPLKIKTATCTIGDPSLSATTAAGTGRINLDLSTTAAVINVKDSATSSTDTGKEPVRIKCNNSANILNQTGGRLGIATDAIGDTATLGTINVTGSSATLNIGSGTTYTNLNISAGTVTAYKSSSSAIISHDGGTLNSEGTYNIGTVHARGGTANFNHRRTVTTVTISRSSQLATVAWTSHGLSVGDQFMVMGADQIQYNGVRIVATVPDANSVTFYVNGTPTSPATGTITATLMAITNLYLYDTASIDLSASVLPFAVGYVYPRGDCEIRVNAANPNHFSFGYMDWSNGKISLID